MSIVNRIAFVIILLCAAASPAQADFIQQGPKLVGSGAVGTALQGRSAAISGDGNTVIVGGNSDDNDHGAAWVYTRGSGVWSQQGAKLVGSDATSYANQGFSVALSADGNTAIVGGYGDAGIPIGAAWVYTRSNGVWSQQGAKLAGTGWVNQAFQGWSVALSADGNTAAVGGENDDSSVGAVWIYTRSNGVWTQQGNKLVGTGAVGQARQGYSVALSADGNTLMAGGLEDGSSGGAAWVFTRSNGVWSQQGNKLVGTGAFGQSVALSADGNTAIIGSPSDNGEVGAVWIYTRSNGVWTQQGNKLVGSGVVGPYAQQGASVSLSADGNTAIVGGQLDNNNVGATWVFTRSNGVWTQQGAKVVGTGATGNATQGTAVALSGDGNTAVVGGFRDSAFVGAAWIFYQPGVLQVTPATAIASSGNPGGPFSPTTFQYTLRSSASPMQYAITGVPSWLTASSTSGTLDMTGTAVTFTVNATANALNNSVVGPDTITFTNTTNGLGNTTRTATLTVSSGALQISPASNIEASGAQFGPFVPSSFTYNLSAASGNVNYTITGVPSWLTASSTGGNVTTALTPITFTVNTAANALPVGSHGPATITFTNTTNGLGTATRSATLSVSDAGTTSVLSAILPASRSVQVGTAATAFATIINVGADPGAACGLALGTSIPATFSFQTTNPATNAAAGTPNTPANIAVGGNQSYVFAITPSAAFAATDVAIIAKCGNSAAAPVVTGLNTLLFSASATPVPDIVALAASVDPGYVDLPGDTGGGAFSVASINVGAAGAITVSADTGSVTLPVAITLCQTNAQAICINPVAPAATASLTIAANATPTFSIFVAGSGNVPNDPANNRVFVRFKDGGVTRGATSVAVRTQ